MRIATGLMMAAMLLTGLVPKTAVAGCKQGFCTSGSDSNGVHSVSFTSTYQNVSHYNVIATRLTEVAFGGGNQVEIGRNVRNFAYYCSNGEKTTYSIQACTKGGVLQGSSCSPWVNFTHTCRF